jgi:hypothetical protein
MGDISKKIRFALCHFPGAFNAPSYRFLFCNTRVARFHAQRRSRRPTASVIKIHHTLDFDSRKEFVEKSPVNANSRRPARARRKAEHYALYKHGEQVPRWPIYAG